MRSYRIGSIRGLYPLSLEQEAYRLERLALALAEGQHQLLELGVALDLEEDLVVVVGDLDVEMLGSGRRRIAAGVVVGGIWCVGHVF
jgi:hypothetical protein